MINSSIHLFLDYLVNHNVPTLRVIEIFILSMQFIKWGWFKKKVKGVVNYFDFWKKWGHVERSLV